MRTVLFVCSANQCRSPMAEGLFKDFLITRGVESSWRVESAGVWASEGASATHNAQRVMQERGIDISSHRSQPTSRDLLGEYHLVLVMENAHKEALQAHYPEFADRIVLFRNLVGEDSDFEDPVGGSLDRFRGAAEKLEAVRDVGFEEITRLSLLG